MRKFWMIAASGLVALGMMSEAKADHGRSVSFSYGNFGPVYGSGYGRSGFGGPVYGGPIYGNPVYGGPIYSSPVYGRPSFGPVYYSQPIYAQPQVYGPTVSYGVTRRNLNYGYSSGPFGQGIVIQRYSGGQNHGGHHYGR